MSEERKARVAATRLGAVRHTKGEVDYLSKTEIEWVILYGVDYRAGKHEVRVMNARNVEDFTDSVRDDLVTHLNGRFTDEHFQAKDIMLFGF